MIHHRNVKQIKLCVWSKTKSKLELVQMAIAVKHKKNDILMVVLEEKSGGH